MCDLKQVLWNNAIIRIVKISVFASISQNIQDRYSQIPSKRSSLLHKSPALDFAGLGAKLSELWTKNQNFKNDRHFEKWCNKLKK